MLWRVCTYSLKALILIFHPASSNSPLVSRNSETSNYAISPISVIAMNTAHNVQHSTTTCYHLHLQSPCLTTSP